MHSKWIDSKRILAVRNLKLISGARNFREALNSIDHHMQLINGEMGRRRHLQRWLDRVFFEQRAISKGPQTAYL